MNRLTLAFLAILAVVVLAGCMQFTTTIEVGPDGDVEQLVIEWDMNETLYEAFEEEAIADGYDSLEESMEADFLADVDEDEVGSIEVTGEESDLGYLITITVTDVPTGELDDLETTIDGETMTLEILDADPAVDDFDYDASGGDDDWDDADDWESDVTFLTVAVENEHGEPAWSGVEVAVEYPGEPEMTITRNELDLEFGAGSVDVDTLDREGDFEVTVEWEGQTVEETVHVEDGDDPEVTVVLEGHPGDEVEDPWDDDLDDPWDEEFDEELEELLDEMSISYVVTMPGAVTDTNAQSVSADGRTVTWELTDYEEGEAPETLYVESTGADPAAAEAAGTDDGTDDDAPVSTDDSVADDHADDGTVTGEYDDATGDGETADDAGVDDGTADAAGETDGIDRDDDAERDDGTDDTLDGVDEVPGFGVVIALVAALAAAVLAHRRSG